MLCQRVAASVVLLVLAVGCPRPSTESKGLVESKGHRRDDRPLPTDPGVSVGTLQNGVRYVLEPSRNSGRATRLALVVRAGSLEEREGERGFAHFVEHVALDPSQRFGELAPSELLARLGETLGADTNAETHFSHTHYFLTLRGSDPELIAQGMDALAGWASGVRFTPEAVERQRLIVLAELRASEDRKAGVFGRVNEYLAAGLGLAERGPLGAQADLQAASAARLEAFYRREYLPRSLTVVATGEFDRATLTSLIQQRFGALPSRVEHERAPSRADSGELPFVPAEKWILGNANQERLPGDAAMLILQLRAQSLRSEHDYRASLMDRYLCALIEDRLGQPPRRERFECMIARPGGGQVQLKVLAWARPGALRTSVEAVLVELQRIVEHGFLETELKRLAPRLLEAIAEDAGQTETLREGSQQLIDYAVAGQAVLSAAQERELGARLLGEIDATALHARARQWLTGSRQVLAAIRADGDDSLASEQALSELARDVRLRRLPPPREAELASELMPVRPKPGTITHSERIEELALHLWTLDNGANVTFRRGRQGGGQAALHAVLRASTQPPPGAETRWNRLHAPRLVQRSGAGVHDAHTLSRLLAGRTTQVHLDGPIRASSSIEDFETSLQLLHLYLTAPRRDPQAFEALLSELRQKPAPGQAFMNALFPEVDRRAVADELDLDAALKAFEGKWGNVSGVTFVIVADLEEDGMRALVEEYLASLPGGPRPPEAAASETRASELTPPSSDRPAAGGIRRVRVAGRPGVESHVVMKFEGTAVPSPEARVELGALEAYLRLRLRQVLREELGGVYDVELAGGWTGDHFFREIRFDCKPEDVERLQRATRDVIAGIDQPGVSDAHLEAIRAQYDAQYPGAFQNDAFWLDELVHAQVEGADPRRILSLPKLSAHITRNSLRLAARRYLPLDTYMDAVWSPESASP